LGGGRAPGQTAALNMLGCRRSYRGPLLGPHPTSINYVGAPRWDERVDGDIMAGLRASLQAPRRVLARLDPPGWKPQGRNVMEREGAWALSQSRTSCRNHSVGISVPSCARALLAALATPSIAPIAYTFKRTRSAGRGSTAFRRRSGRPAAAS
jgi:hypothetical protein